MNNTLINRLFTSVRTAPALVLTATLFFLICTYSPIGASAQSKAGLSPECIKYMSYYQEDYKAKDFDRALPNWRKAFELCPGTASQNLFVHGTTLYTRLYTQTKDAAAKEAIVDTVLMLQDRRMELYPGKRVAILNNKGGYIINYRGKDARYVYDNLGPIVTELGGQTSESILVNYMKAATELQKKGTLSKEAYIDTYSLVEAGFDTMPVFLKAGANPTEREKAEKARGVVESLFSESGVATCESLFAIYSPKLRQAPENVSLASTVLRLLGSVDGCVDNDLYMKAAMTVHRSEPSFRSAYALYRMNLAKGNGVEAMGYLEEAASLAGAGSEDEAKATLELAQLAYKEGMRGKAYAAARKATGMGDAYAGKAWILIGNLWSSARPEKEVDKFAKLWAAADCYARAKSADASLKEEADSLTASVAKYYPAAADMFMYELSAGQGYDVYVEGMSAHTTVRTRK